MNILENGKLVGSIDDQTLELVESQSAKLTALIDDWRANGVDIAQAQQDPLEDGQVCGSEFVNVRFEPESLHIFEMQLLIAVYDTENG
jgi:hypothetical protein